MKICPECGEEVVGRRSDARFCSHTCTRKYNRKKHYRRNPEKFRGKRLAENSNVKKRIITRIRSKSRREGIEFNISEEDLDIPAVCPVLGIELCLNGGKGSGYHDDSPSVDKIYPDRGYTKGNVRVVSARANLLKSNASIEELEAVLDDLRRLYEEGT